MEVKSCVCCLFEFEEGTKICETCHEGWVCKECLENYRKYWHEQCCICKKGDKKPENVIVDIPQLTIDTSDNQGLRRSSRLEFILSGFVTLLCLFSGVACVYMWVNIEMQDNPTNLDIVFRVTVFDCLTMMVCLLWHIDRLNFAWDLLLKIFLLEGNCCYLLISYLTNMYGNFIYYLSLVIATPLLLLIVPTFFFLMFKLLTFLMKTFLKAVLSITCYTSPRISPTETTL